MAAKAQPLRLLEKQSELEPIPLEERRTDELVIGMVGPVASGVSFCADIIADMLKTEFNYHGGTIIKVSKLINDNATKVGASPSHEDDKNRTKNLQLVGSKLRATFGAHYLAEKCVEQISMNRGDPKAPSAPRRIFTIIDSLKNPDEIQLLQDVYGENFWLFGIFAPDPIRKSRLHALGFDPVYAVEIIERDQDEGIRHGQQVRETMQLSDFFIRNDTQNSSKLRTTVERFLEIIFGTQVHTPTHDEEAMFAATSAAASSACLSRQVGAVIMTSAGDIIGRGMNDVPRFGGGLYTAADKEDDHRCYKWRTGICHNDERKRKLLDQSLIALKASKSLKAGKDTEAAAALRGTNVRNLIEFSRSIHAEMEAIISIARSGKQGMVGSTLYTTTFPCHSCARHIVASGINRVIYVEPYTKSLALDLHEDAISIDESDSNKVRFLQYEGVASRNMVRLFKDRGSRKKNGKVDLPPKATAHPATRGPLDGLAAREHIVVVQLRQRESKDVT
ncbi:MAG: anti-phage dCTP deaminase [Pseudomonadota bacterium]